ncbi:hypothetical protein LCGC14_2776040, partial [marine sediment metagenome]
MRPEPTVIAGSLPEEIFEHREWFEYLRIKVHHRCPHGSKGWESYYAAPSFVYDVISLMHKRKSAIEREINSDWDYLRIEPEIGIVEELEGYGWDTKASAPDANCVENSNWLSIRVYARAYRLRPMSNEKAEIARELVAKYLDASALSLEEIVKKELRISPDAQIELVK